MLVIDRVERQFIENIHQIVRLDNQGSVRGEKGVDARHEIGEIGQVGKGVGDRNHRRGTKFLDDRRRRHGRRNSPRSPAGPGVRGPWRDCSPDRRQVFAYRGHEMPQGACRHCIPRRRRGRLHQGSRHERRWMRVRQNVSSRSRTWTTCRDSRRTWQSAGHGPPVGHGRNRDSARRSTDSELHRRASNSGVEICWRAPFPRGRGIPRPRRRRTRCRVSSRSRQSALRRRTREPWGS